METPGCDFAHSAYGSRMPSEMPPYPIPGDTNPPSHALVRQASFAGGFFPFLPAVNYHNEMPDVEENGVSVAAAGG